MKNINFYPKQYTKDQKIKLNHSYLIEQFSDYSKILKKVIKVIKKGDRNLLLSIIDNNNRRRYLGVKLN